MKPNPGGNLSLNDIVGREGLVEYLQTTIAQQSVLLVAERRTGKTHVLEKFKADAPKDWVVLKRDVGAIRSAKEFVECVMADLYPHLEAKTNFRNWLNGLGGQLGGAQIGPVKLPNFDAKNWKQILSDAVAHLEENKDIARLVFLWDELPWMLEIITKHHPQEAMELLDTLRALRQQHGSKLRMVFTGSLGLHHVVRSLKEQGYNNTPVNDMLPVEVEPLAQKDATDLVRRLLADSGLTVTGVALHGHLAQAVDFIPFYIHHVVSALLKTRTIQKQALDIQAIDAVITKGITSSDNPWDLQHYEERTLAYYGNNRAYCLALLDVVASCETTINFSDTVKRAKAEYPTIEQQQWLELTRLLERDHYFKRNDAGALHFKFNVVRRWWLWHRNLSIVKNGGAA